MPQLDERFKETISVVAAGCAQVSTANAAADVPESKVAIPMKPAPGLTYRIKAAGTKTGANNAMVVYLKIGATQVLTLTADDATAVDWVAEIVVRFTAYNAQKIMGILLTNTADPETDYAAGTVDCSAGADMVLQVASANASDTVTCEMVTVEKWSK